MRKFGLLVGIGATVAAAVVTSMPVASTDPGRVGIDSAGASAHQYPPITPGVRAPGLSVGVNLYPPITPGARPPGAAPGAGVPAPSGTPGDTPAG